MSGGHFCDGGYVYLKVAQFADELEEEIFRNGKKREDNGYYGEEYYPSYEPETIEYLKEQVPKMRKMAEIMRLCDYLYSGDCGDESFVKRVKEIEENVNDVLIVDEF